MKYRKRFFVCSLIGLIVLISSCSGNKASLQLLHFADLDFPSASAIEFYQGKLFVFGDDAPYLLVLNTAYEKIDSLHFWSKPGKISKEDKHDIESAFIANWNNELVLYGVGSMSAEKRWGALAYNLNDRSLTDVSLFNVGFTFPKIKTINIEGSCTVGDTIIFSNRANLTTPVNHLLVHYRKNNIAAISVTLPKTEITAGVSGLYYVKEKDMLLLTASEEETKDAINDGMIGESYLGIINRFSKRLNDTTLKPDQFIKLSDIHPEFSRQKIESVCAEKPGTDELILHLVADNDNGKSRIFKMRFPL